MAGKLLNLFTYFFKKSLPAESYVYIGRKMVWRVEFLTVVKAVIAVIVEIAEFVLFGDGPGIVI